MSFPAAGPSKTPVVRLMTPEDRSAFSRFVADVPEGERRFLKEQAGDHVDVLADSGSRARRLVALEPSGDIVGAAGAFPAAGWSSHVAEVRVLVSASRRRRGTGRALARAALAEALKLGCTHTYVEVVAEQEGLVEMFQDMGFEPEALLVDFVRDGTGEFHDLLLLTHRAQDQWSRNTLLGLDEVVA
jgi:GNAT superfamily N-acetyltransferase